MVKTEEFERLKNRFDEHRRTEEMLLNNTRLTMDRLQNLETKIVELEGLLIDLAKKEGYVVKDVGL